MQRRALGKLLYILLTLTAVASPVLSVASISTQLTTSEKQQLQREARLVVDLLQNHHYTGRAFREFENKEMVARFLERLDPTGDFFTNEDKESIHRRFDRTFKTVYLFRGDLQPAFEIYDRYAERVRARLTWVDRRLTEEFDLTVDEVYHLPRKPAVQLSALPTDQRWEQHLKNRVLSEILAGRTPDEARAEVVKRYGEFGRRVSARDTFAIRELFFDTVIQSFDPHSGYFSADSTREFEIDMESAVNGIGLELRKEEGRCVVAAVHPGGPADLHSNISSGDTILAFADGDGAEIDTAKLRLREIVARIRGPAGRPLQLVYQPEGSRERISVTLERARVVLPADRARGAVSDVPDSSGRIRQIGWIYLPRFYGGGNGVDATSSATDMRELLEQMARHKIEGLVIDLRDNPGGALSEAVAINQLFLPRGVMMLSRALGGKLSEHTLKDESPAYAGPLVVLTSGHSASASEILAGALKYHRRAVVIGSATTYGKGTSQAYIPLSKLSGVDPKFAENWGTLRLTSERFFLPDGQAVQRAGVASHIVLPDIDHPDLEREATLPQALSEDSVTPLATLPKPESSATSEELLQHLSEVAARHFRELPEWKLWSAEKNYQQTHFERETHSLQQEARQKARDESLHQFQTTQIIRRSLSASLAYATRPIEIASVTAAFSARETRLRTLERTDESLLRHRLRRGGFWVETDQGHLREIRLDAISASSFFGDAEALAFVFTEASNRPTTAAEARRILEQLDLIDPKTETVLLTAVNRITGDTLARPALRRGTEAMLGRMTELNTEMRQTRAPLDIPLRESQRLAAAWADWLTREL